MNLLKSIYFNFREKGIVRTLTIIVYRFFDFHFDLKYKTDTSGRISLEKLMVASENRERGTLYMPTMAIPLNRLMDKMSLPADSVMVDFGCGKGRVLLLSALRGIRKAVGIEFSAELCKIAKKNIAIMEKYLGRKLDINIIESDVSHYEIEKEQNVFFLFNPFDDVILNTVIANILESLEKQRRRILIIYYNPIHAGIIARYFTQKEKHIIAGEEYLLYENYSSIDKNTCLGK